MDFWAVVWVLLAVVGIAAAARSMYREYEERREKLQAAIDGKSSPHPVLTELS